MYIPAKRNKWKIRALIHQAKITHNVWGIRNCILDRGFLQNPVGAWSPLCIFRPKILIQPEGYFNLKYLRPSCTGIKMVKICSFRVCAKRSPLIVASIRATNVKNQPYDSTYRTKGNQPVQQIIKKMAKIVPKKDDFSSISLSFQLKILEQLTRISTQGINDFEL